MSHWDPAVLKRLPTLHQGQCCDCKVDNNGVRIWVCRVYGGVSVEQYMPATGRWEMVSGGCDSPGGPDG